MRAQVLCRERLKRIEQTLTRLGGTAPIRDLRRSHGIQYWELRQAKELGWLTIEKRKPRTGRPSYVVTFRESENAKLPPYALFIEKTICPRHRLFAKRSVFECVHRGMRRRGFPSLPGNVRAYLETYQPKSLNGAYVSTSRLLKRRDVRAAQQWFFAQLSGEIPRHEEMPETPSGIRDKLRAFGSWRARNW